MHPVMGIKVDVQPVWNLTAADPTLLRHSGSGPQRS
jgi:hypothetical protein